MKLNQKMQKKGTFATEKCPFHQFDRNENLADMTFFSGECSLFFTFLGFDGHCDGQNGLHTLCLLR